MAENGNTSTQYYRLYLSELASVIHSSSPLTNQTVLNYRPPTLCTLQLPHQSVLYWQSVAMGRGAIGLFVSANISLITCTMLCELDRITMQTACNPSATVLVLIYFCDQFVASEIRHNRRHCSICQQPTWYSATRTRFW